MVDQKIVQMWIDRAIYNARYKEDLKQLSRGINEKVVQDFIQFSEEMMAWFFQKMK